MRSDSNPSERRDRSTEPNLRRSERFKSKVETVKPPEPVRNLTQEEFSLAKRKGLKRTIRKPYHQEPEPIRGDEYLHPSGDRTLLFSDFLAYEDLRKRVKIEEGSHHKQDGNAAKLDDELTPKKTVSQVSHVCFVLRNQGNLFLNRSTPARGGPH